MELLKFTELSPPDESKDSSLDLGLSTQSEKPQIEMEGATAAWMLFQFDKRSNEKSATHQIRNVLPNGDLRVVDIEVRCNATKIENGKEKPLGLPGAFAQDVYIGLIDILISQIKEGNQPLSVDPKVSNELDVFSKQPNSLPNQVHFRNKDVAQRMGMAGKNARITHALRHLQQTHIRLRGCIYTKDGEEKTLVHESYYIPSLTMAKKISKGAERSELHQASFDERLIGHILQGYIAQMDREKLLSLPSGATRKLYTLIAAKTLEAGESDTIFITQEELETLLRIPRRRFKGAARKYLDHMVRENILVAYSFSRHRQTNVVVGKVRKTSKVALTTQEQKVDEFFGILEKLAARDPSLRRTLREVDFDAVTLRGLVKKNDPVEHLGGNDYLRTLLWADMILFAISSGQQGVRSALALLKSILKKKEQPVVPKGYEPYDQRLLNTEASVEAEQVIRQRDLKAAQEEQAISDRAIKVWDNYSEKQKKKLFDCIEGMTFDPDNQLLLRIEGARKTSVAVKLVEKGIASAIPVSQVDELIRLYRENPNIGAEL